MLLNYQMLISGQEIKTYNNPITGDMYILAPGGLAISNTIFEGASIGVGEGSNSDEKATFEYNIINGGYIGGGIVQAANFTSNILNDGTMEAYAGVAIGNTVNGGSVNLPQGKFINNTVHGGNLTIVGVGAFVSVTDNVFEGGNISVGGNVANNSVLLNAVVSIFNNGIANNNIINSGGSVYLTDGALATSNIIESQGNLYVLGGASAQNNVVNDGGTIEVFSGGMAQNNHVSSGAHLVVDSGGTLQDMTIYSGGSAVLDSGANLTGNVMLEKGGYLAITTSTGGTVNFTDTTMPLYLLRDGTVIGNINTGLVISGRGDATTVISSFTGTSVDDSDKITLANVQQSDVKQVTYPDVDHVKFDLQDGSSITLNVIGVQEKGFALGSDVNGALIYEVCFLTGTLISMANGICAVEDIQIGDRVTTYDPQTQKKSQRVVTWVGKKTAHVKPARFDDEAGYPIRILKDAIAENVPNKDLLVTAEHCLFFNGYFTPARMFVNGYSIYYDHSLTTYDYYHIETDKHSVIMADGMLTESYLDTGNRHIFAPEQKIVSLKGKSWDKDAAAPLMVERSVIEPLYRQIEERAYAMGCEYKAMPVQTTDDADLRLITDKGQVISDNLNSYDGRIVFIIPAHTKSVRIVSRIRRLSNIVGSFVNDRNYTGVLIGDMYVSGHKGIRAFNIHMELEALEGWHAKDHLSRWTKGDAFLPLDQLGDFDTPIYLSMKILDGGPYILEDHEEESQKQSA